MEFTIFCSPIRQHYADCRLPVAMISNSSSSSDEKNSGNSRQNYIDEQQWMCYCNTRTLKVFAFVRGHKDFELCGLYLFQPFLVRRQGGAGNDTRNSEVVQCCLLYT